MGSPPGSGGSVCPGDRSRRYPDRPSRNPGRSPRSRLPPRVDAGGSFRPRVSHRARQSPRAYPGSGVDRRPRLVAVDHDVVHVVVVGPLSGWVRSPNHSFVPGVAAVVEWQFEHLVGSGARDEDAACLGPPQSERLGPRGRGSATVLRGWNCLARRAPSAPAPPGRDVRGR